MVKERDQRRKDKIQRAQKAIQRKISEKESSTAPLIDEADVAFLAQSSVKWKQTDILRAHVKNWADLDLK